GRSENVLVRVLDGEELGTLFVPSRRDRTSSRSRWIGAARPAGVIVIDDGAARAVSERNTSLLPAGVKSVSGDFDKGDVVAVETTDGRRLAHGLTNYAAIDLDAIRGKKSVEVKAILQDRAYDEVIHRDNLVKLS
ncbi:MAG TPA: PUA domain-containing protein, partial [Tepidisphaeraceae bacterium]